MTITPEEIARLRALEAKATPGPWPEDYVHGAVRHLCRNVDRDAFCYGPSDPDFYWDRYCDGPFITESRNALPGLLDEIERLRADLREAVALLRTDSVNGDTFFAWRDRRDALLAKHKEML